MNGTSVPESLLPPAGEGWMRVFPLLAKLGLYKKETLTLPSPASGKGNAAR